MAIKRVIAPEDGNLSTSVLSANRKVQYSDVDISFAAKPSGDVYLKKDLAAVKQALKNLITTNHFEKPFNPYYGANITSLLFELADDYTSTDIEKEIIETINFYEPRVEILDIFVNSYPENNSISVEIRFKIINTLQETTLNISLSRLR